MSGTITLALRTAQSGLLTSQAAMQTVANNIANVNTPNYSRQVVNAEQRVLAGAGAGVQISDITRRVDEGLLKSLRLEKSDFNQLDAQTTYYARMQELFGNPGQNTTLSHYINEFTQALETLGVSPDKTLNQSEVVRWGNEVALKLQEMTSTIQELRQQADNEIASVVTEINDQLTDIVGLNDKIVRNSAVNLDTADLRDQRDAALDSLAESIDMRYFYRGGGDVVVFTSGGRTLLENTAQTVSHDAAGTVASTTTHAEGDFAGIYVGEAVASNDITNEIRSGKLKGLIDLRDNVLAGLQSQIDELAAEVRDVVNQIHNRGAPFPGLETATGTRLFIAPTVQTMKLDPTSGADDVAITLFDSNGDQQATTTLETIMMSAAFGSGAQPANGPWTISEVAATLEDWFQANGAASASVAVGSDGKFAIDLNSTTRTVAFRDQTATTAGSTAADAEIGFDANGDGVIDETVSGFSYFLGLNDFFVDNMADNIHESNVLASTFTGTAATITVRDSTGVLGSVAITAGESLSDIADAITDGISNVTATVVPDGAGVRLRISHDQGSSMVVTEAAGNTFLTDIGMHSADVRVASQIEVRSDIMDSSANVSRGAIQWDANRGASGQYFMSIGDATIAQALAEAFTGNNAFNAAGGLGAKTIPFDQYAAAIVGNNSSLGAANQTKVDFHQTLTESLEAKSNSVKGVNLDEEMASLLVYQQAFTAAARVIVTIQHMFDALEGVVR